MTRAMTRMQRAAVGIGVVILAASTFPMVAAAGAAEPDPLGVLRKPIPDKLVVLTFDDGCASGATVVAPILKHFGFGGSFYVCDFDSFSTRKDWYLTWRQMRAMAAEGFEIGNHSVGHTSGLDAMLKMEYQLQANRIAKPTTIAWPLYMVNYRDSQAMSSDGYTFARGGHERPYRPTVDNPFDVPSYSVHEGGSIEQFPKMVREACQGRIVVICYHGVPDMEHPWVTLDSEIFKAQMQYLKDNHYKVIALRDLAEYIDPIKALKLPQTAQDWKDPSPGVLASEEKPYVAPGNVIEHFGFPNVPCWVSGNSVRVTVPYHFDLTAMVFDIRVPNGTTISPDPKVARDFTRPQTYTLRGRDGSTRTYTVTVSRRPVSTAKDILAFSLPQLEGKATVARAGSDICIHVPAGVDVTKLTPAFTLSPLAKAEPTSGTALDFSAPQKLTVTAEDGSKRIYGVRVIKETEPTSLAWAAPGGGNFSDSAKWSNLLGMHAAPTAAGKSGYSLDFSKAGPNAVKNDLHKGFLLNHLILAQGSAGMSLEGNSMAFVRDPAGVASVIQTGRDSQRVNINVDLDLRDGLGIETSADINPNSFILLNGLISGDGGLMLDSYGDPDVVGATFHDGHYGVVQIGQTNTYRGGTVVRGGKVIVNQTGGLGTGPVTLENFGRLEGPSHSTNPLTINSGTLFHCAWNGPVRLNAVASLIGNCEIAGDMSGPGGIAMLGTNGPYLGMVPGGTVTLRGKCDYAGPTTVFPGTLVIEKAAGLYNADPAKWTPANITIHKAATLRLSVGGKGEFTGPQVSALLENLTKNVDNNGLMGGCTLCLDTSNATETVKLASRIADGAGPGGGPFVLRRVGGGTLELSGRNTYTGPTIVEDGDISVESLNSVAGGKPASSLGAPSSLENGTIELGGNCSLIYTGTGEVTDRILNLTGGKQTITLDQAGAGLLKFTSPFDISGYGHGKILVLTGAGNGELAGAIVDPFDPAKAAAMALTKTGSGTWTLSGENTYSGATTVKAGTLAIAGPKSLGPRTKVTIDAGGTLELKFRGEAHVAALTLGGKAQPAGRYDARNTNGLIKGSGGLVVE